MQVRAVGYARLFTQKLREETLAAWGAGLYCIGPTTSIPADDSEVTPDGPCTRCKGGFGERQRFSSVLAVGPVPHNDALEDAERDEQAHERAAPLADEGQ